jgi:hypothetical protein
MSYVSDLESDLGSDLESVSNTVCDEIGQLIERCEELHEHIHNSFETLKTVHTLIQNQTNIIVSYDGWTGDLDELLEKAHLETLKEIKEKGINTFGDKLLNTIDLCVFGE